MCKIKDFQTELAQCDLCNHWVKKTELKTQPKNDWEDIQICPDCIFENAEREYA